MLQFASSQFSNLRWRYFVESLLLKSTPNVSSVVLSSARVAGVDRADARASSVAREPPRAAGFFAGFFGETAAFRAGFLAAGLATAAGFLGDAAAARFGLGEAAGLAAGFAAGFLGEAGLRLRGSGVAERFGWTRVGFGDLGAALGLALGLRPRTYFWTLPP